MNMEESLQKLGLDDKEAKVYIAVLNLGQTRVADIAKAADLKRPTVYNVLESLKRKGLVSYLPKGATAEYKAANPKRLRTELNTQLRLADSIIPTLQSIQPQKTDRPKITVIEGKDKMADVYLEMFESPEIYFYGTDMELFSQEFAGIMAEAEKMFIERKTRTKEIMNHTPGDIAYAKKRRSEYRHIRTTPTGLRFGEDSAIWQNKVWIASIREPFFGVLIESESIANTYRAIFEMAWQSAVEPE